MFGLELTAGMNLLHVLQFISIRLTFKYMFQNILADTLTISTIFLRIVFLGHFRVRLIAPAPRRHECWGNIIAVGIY